MEITRKERKEIMDIKSIKLKPLQVKFDITTLDMIISFIYKDSVLRTRRTLTNMYKLFTNLDLSVYADSPKLIDRIWVIKKSLYGRLYDGFESDPEFLKQYCRDAEECTEYALDIIDDISNRKISHDESKYLIKKIDDTLEFGYTITIKDIIKKNVAVN